MPSERGFLYRIENGEITVTGYEGEISYLQIPEELEGLPVRRVGKSAFAKRKDLVYVRLPENLRTLERFAFYDCPLLERAVLGGGITDYYDGVFRQCGSLREVEINLSGGRFTVLKDLLADYDRTLRVQLRLADGEACLTFPDFLMVYDEDTFARAFHSHFEGWGYACRECVSRKGIDFRGYDRTFERISRTDIPLAAQIALDRLCRPYALEEKAGREYEEFLRREAGTVILQVVSSGREEWLRLLTDRQLLTQEAVRAGIQAASAGGKTVFVTILMNSLPRSSGRTRFRL